MGRYGDVMDGIRLDEGMKHKMTKALLVPLCFFLRRIIIAASAIFVQQNIIWNFFLQITFPSIMIITIATNSFMVSSKVELMNEMTSTALSYTILCLTYFVSDVRIRDNIGYVYIK